MAETFKLLWVFETGPSRCRFGWRHCTGRMRALRWTLRLMRFGRGRASFVLTEQVDG